MKFVRIKPGSILQQLYPLNQHNPDKCMLCGGSSRDHLTLWWSKHLYTPYDLHLDKVYNEGVFVREEPAPVGVKRRNKSKIPPLLETIHAYHRRYVFDLSLLLQNGSQKQGEREKKLSQADSILTPFGPLEIRKLGSSKPTYAVPALGQNLGMERPLVKFVRSIVLTQVDGLISTQALDNALRNTIPLML